MNRIAKLRIEMFLIVSEVVVVTLLAGCPPDPKCTAGTAGCACLDGKACSSSLKCNVVTICVNPDDDNGAPPEHPVCYTPCNHSYTDAKGTYFECSADGLMKRCLDGTKCVDGTCSATEAESASASKKVISTGKTDAGLPTQSTAIKPGSCSANVECPDFQVCIEGN